MFDAMIWARDITELDDGLAKSVLMSLASRCDQMTPNSCWPGQATIAKNIGQKKNKRGVLNTLKALAAVGLISKQYRDRSGSLKYVLHLRRKLTAIGEQYCLAYLKHLKCRGFDKPELPPEPLWEPCLFKTEKGQQGLNPEGYIEPDDPKNFGLEVPQSEGVVHHDTHPPVHHDTHRRNNIKSPPARDFVTPLAAEPATPTPCSPRSEVTGFCPSDKTGNDIGNYIGDKEVVEEPVTQVASPTTQSAPTTGPKPPSAEERMDQPLKYLSDKIADKDNPTLGDIFGDNKFLADQFTDGKSLHLIPLKAIDWNEVDEEHRAIECSMPLAIKRFEENRTFLRAFRCVVDGQSAREGWRILFQQYQPMLIKRALNFLAEIEISRPHKVWPENVHDAIAKLFYLTYRIDFSKYNRKRHGAPGGKYSLGADGKVIHKVDRKAQAR